MVLQRWHREQLAALVPHLLEKWQPMLGVEAVNWTIKKMKTKWCSGNTEARRIWLNLELVKNRYHALNISLSTNWFICWSGIITTGSLRS